MDTLTALAAKIDVRSQELVATYRGHREALSPVMRSWIGSFAAASDEIELIREEPDAAKRGEKYLELVCVLLTVGEHTLTHLTACELSEMADRMLMAKQATS